MAIFNSDALAKIMTFLILFIGLAVGSFAKNYLRGDLKQKDFFIKLPLLMTTVIVLVNADHLLLFWSAWVISNLLLTSLMIHKISWEAARNSGFIALQDFGFGALLLGAGFLLIYYNTGITNISEFVIQHEHVKYVEYSLLLIILAAMTQSAIWPLHRWLLSSLNSPTPVSALMHAGLLNAGGFLLVRFAPLLLQHHALLNMVFIAGLISAVMGTFWKLMQNDIKRMLACSTMGQMGFTFLQCGLGLFPAAIAHLVYHGMFKAYLFLNSGSAAQESRLDIIHPISISHLLISLIFGFLGSLTFAHFAEKSWLILDTNILLLVVTLISTTQIALHTMENKGSKHLLMAMSAALIFGGFYGWSVNLITNLMANMQIMQPQPLNMLHWFAIFLLSAPWLMTLLFKIKSKTFELHPILAKLYVSALNASQPHPKTITAIRNQYSYK